MKKTIDISFYDLEDDDRIAGFSLKDLICFATILEHEGINNTDINDFMHNASRLEEMIRKEYEKIWDETIASVFVRKEESK